MHADSDLLLAHLQLRQLQRQQRQYQDQQQQLLLLLAQPSSAASGPLDAAAQYSGSFADLQVQNALVSTGSYGCSHTTNLEALKGAFTWPEEGLQAVASLSTPVMMPSLPRMTSSGTAAAAAAAGGSGTAAPEASGSVGTGHLRSSRHESEPVVSHDSSSGPVSMLAAAVAQEMLDQMLQLEGMQQQLMDEVIALLPLM
jgi:Tfp pilus assembly protein PilV